MHTPSSVEPSIRNMWLELHQRHFEEIANAKHPPEVMFVGDSLTEAWKHQPVWTQEFSKYNPINIGIGGDRTQHLLWRLQQLPLPKAKLFNLLIGTNNIGKNSPSEIVLGIKACVDEILKQQPNSKILLQNLLPRQFTRSNPFFKEVIEVNRRIPEIIQSPQVIPADFSHVFSIDQEEHLNRDHVMEDCVHFTEKGYRAWATELIPVLDQTLIS